MKLWWNRQLTNMREIARLSWRIELTTTWWLAVVLLVWVSGLLVGARACR